MQKLNDINEYVCYGLETRPLREIIENSRNSTLMLKKPSESS